MPPSQENIDPPRNACARLLQLDAVEDRDEPDLVALGVTPRRKRSLQRALRDGERPGPEPELEEKQRAEESHLPQRTPAHLAWPSMEAETIRALLERAFPGAASSPSRIGRARAITSR